MIKYLISGLLVGIILKLTTGLDIDNKVIFTITCLSMVTLFASDILFKSGLKKENMESVGCITNIENMDNMEGMKNISVVIDPPKVQGLCNTTVKIVNLDRILDKQSKPEYKKFVVDDPDFSKINKILTSDNLRGDIHAPQLEVKDGTCKDKMNSMEEQSAHFTRYSHPHIGKGRGRLNWADFYKKK
jgi:hypothetical protein